MARDIDTARVIAHPHYLALGPAARAAYFELLTCDPGRATIDAVDAILARSSYGANALVELQDAGLLDTEPADWGWWVRLPWIAEGAEVVADAEACR